MKTSLPGQLQQLLPLMELLIFTAEQTAGAARKTYKELTRKRRGETLRPGDHTPLWNELARAARAEIRQHGEKARLARVLGVPRQRVHQYIREGSACPDAERTLLLLAWVQARRNGRDFL